MDLAASQDKRPWGLKWRSSVWFCTIVVFFSVMVDLLVYSVIIPVIPFRLEEIGYRNPSALTGWLLVAFSLGLILSTPPLAYLSERSWSRRTPLVVAVVLLVGSQAMFMEARAFWLMCLARVLQGVASATVWVVAFALLCDTVPESRIGQQLGIVMMGLTLGLIVAPPLGGVLNEKIGYRAPFVFGMIACAIDLIGRFLVIERDAAVRWLPPPPTEEDPEGNVATPAPARVKSQLTPLTVVIKLCKSRRAVTAFIDVFIYGISITMLEPTLPLRLQDLYGYTSLKVGIVFLAAVVPSIFSTPLAGWIADRVGVEWVMVACLLASLPWWIVMAIRGKAALFIASLAVAEFFLAAVVTPVSTDLTAAARETEGIGYAHVFGAFNFAYSCASVVGPLIGGQVYSHVRNGWTVLMGLGAGLMLVSAIASAYGSGDHPLWSRMMECSIRLQESETEAHVVSETTAEKEKLPQEA